MKKSIKVALTGLLVAPVLALGTIVFAPATQSVFADSSIQQGANTAQGDNNVTCLFTSSTCQNGIFTTITNTALFIIGALSVIMLIYGGIRYTISMGDAKNVETAKNTIMYAIIGIIVALLAYAIVNFVLGSLIKA
jgi:hypothetical protein